MLFASFVPLKHAHFPMNTFNDNSKKVWLSRHNHIYFLIIRFPHQRVITEFLLLNHSRAKRTLEAS